MKVLLMHPERDFNAGQPLPEHAAVVRQDLALDLVLEAMAAGDKFVSSVCANALLNSTDNDVETIRYRQAALKDGLAHPEPVRAMYALADSALEEKRRSSWGLYAGHPSSILFSSIQVLRLFMDKLRTLREIATTHAAQFESAALRQLGAMLQCEFEDAYLARVAAQLVELESPHGTLMSAHLGPHGESDGYALRRPNERDAGWLQRLLKRTPSAFTVRIAQRDTTGAKTLSEMRDRGINEVANALAQSVDHIQGFFEMLRAELAFHVGCINLHERLTADGIPVCFPEAAETAEPGFLARELRDVALLLSIGSDVVGNTINAKSRQLVIITGANQGGKSTCLRSLGLAQLMLQAGMFVTAEAFSASLCSGLFTHYKREEDAAMEQGKLDEELARISAIADVIRPGALLLCNESFASTNEREGSEIARQITEAFLTRGVRVVFVTHQYTFARNQFEQGRPDALFLRAERRVDGARTFRLIAGAPLETSYGADLYREIFGPDESAPTSRAAGDSSNSSPGTSCPARVQP